MTFGGVLYYNVIEFIYRKVERIMIYGVALLAGCMFTGCFIGNLLGALIGLNSDVGGVGFAMLLLLLITNSKKISGKLPKGTAEGLNFWKNMFIPITIAMSASQDVYHAISGGVFAIVAGVMTVVFAFVIMILLNSVAKKNAGKNTDKEVEPCNK